MNCKYQESSSFRTWIFKAYHHPGVKRKALDMCDYLELDRNQYKTLIHEAMIKVLSKPRHIQFTHINFAAAYLKMAIQRVATSSRFSSRLQKEKIYKNIEDYKFFLKDERLDIESRVSQLDFETMIDLLEDSTLKDLLKLRYQDGFKFREIAELKKMNINTVFTQHKRAIDHLRIRLRQ